MSELRRCWVKVINPFGLEGISPEGVLTKACSKYLLVKRRKSNTSVRNTIWPKNCCTDIGYMQIMGGDMAYHLSYLKKITLIFVDRTELVVILCLHQWCQLGLFEHFKICLILGLLTKVLKDRSKDISWSWSLPPPFWEVDRITCAPQNLFSFVLADKILYWYWLLGCCTTDSQQLEPLYQVYTSWIMYLPPSSLTGSVSYCSAMHCFIATCAPQNLSDAALFGKGFYWCEPL